MLLGDIVSYVAGKVGFSGSTFNQRIRDWAHLRQQMIWNDGNPIVNQRFVRPGLLDALPVNELGELVDPLERIVGNYDSLTFNRDWTVGEIGRAHV